MKTVKICTIVSLLALCSWVDKNGRAPQCDQRPTCSGINGCQTPTDLDDCVMCCVLRDGGGITACRDCCSRGYAEGSAAWRSCNNVCDTNLSDYQSAIDTGMPI